MDREILFRGKRVDNGAYIQGFYAKSCDTSLILIDNDILVGYVTSKEVIPKTIGQYTGLKDKNGKKIFEGDIVKATYNGECEKTYQVMFFNGGYKMKSKDCQTVYDYSIHDEHPDFEVIGNIHDNPELLEDNNGN